MFYLFYQKLNALSWSAEHVFYVSETGVKIEGIDHGSETVGDVIAEETEKGTGIELSGAARKEEIKTQVRVIEHRKGKIGELIMKRKEARWKKRSARQEILWVAAEAEAVGCVIGAVKALIETNKSRSGMEAAGETGERHGLRAEGEMQGDRAGGLTVVQGRKVVMCGQMLVQQRVLLRGYRRVAATRQLTRVACGVKAVETATRIEDEVWIKAGRSEKRATLAANVVGVLEKASEMSMDGQGMVGQSVKAVMSDQDVASLGNHVSVRWTHAEASIKTSSGLQTWRQGWRRWTRWKKLRRMKRIAGAGSGGDMVMTTMTMATMMREHD